MGRVALLAGLLVLLVFVHAGVDHAGGTPNECGFMLKAARPCVVIAGLTEPAPGGVDPGLLQSVSLVPMVAWTNGFLQPEPPLIALLV